MTASEPTALARLPLVSAVVPCLNRAGFLQETLDSILGQDYPALECIVADGGSTDGTLDILKGFGARLQWFSRPDGGPFDAIEAGWARARGEILTWLNADDTWEPGAVRRAAEYFLSHPEVDVVYGAVGGVDERGRRVWWGPAQAWNLERAVLECDHVINQPGTFVHRRAVMAAGPLYRGWVHDQDLWIRIALNGGRFAALPEHLANGRIHAANRGMDLTTVLPAKRALIERTLADPRLPRAIARQQRRALSNVAVRGFHYLKPGRPRDWWTGLRLLGSAIREDPTNGPHALAELTRLLVRRARRDVGRNRP
ncbi:MAG: glycosyltransferase [Dehalococcoidia bacterium]|nr:glycosyltransferase [Dehalococcoidia bacterium]